MRNGVVKLFTAINIVLGTCVAINDYMQLQIPQEYESDCARHRRLAGRDGLRGKSVQPGPFEIELIVTEGRFESDFVSFNTRTYNGQMPGPTIKVCNGDNLIITLKNNLGFGDVNFTNIHTHGLDTSPLTDHDDVYTPVAPGGSKVYEYPIHVGQSYGTNWYHPHKHTLVNEQLAGFMAGALIIVDDTSARDYPPELLTMDDIPIILQGVCMQNCNNIRDTLEYALLNRYTKDTVQGPGDMNLDIRFDPSKHPLNDSSLVSVFVNGQIRPTLNMFRNEYKRLRLVNAIPNNNAEIFVPNCEMHLIAVDGIYQKHGPQQRNVVIVPAGGRAEIIVGCPTEGVFYVQGGSLTEFDHAMGLMNDHRIPHQDLLQLVVTTPKQMPGYIATKLPKYLPRAAINSIDLTSAPVLPQNKFSYTFTTTQVVKNGTTKDVYAVNQIVMADEPGYTANVGSVQEFRLSSINIGANCTNVSTIQCKFRTHPFHLHNAHFQVVYKDPEYDPQDLLFKVGEWRDTLPVYQSAGGIIIRFVPQPYMIGNVLTHCHISSHSDQGMGLIIRVI